MTGWYFHSEWAMVWITTAYVLVALFTLLAIQRQLKIGLQQADAARQAADAAKASADAATRSNEILKETTIKQLRAYVCLNAAVLTFPQTAVPIAQIQVKNCGQTPAYDVRGWIHTWFAEYPLPKNVVLPRPSEDFRKGTETLAPERHSTFLSGAKPSLPPTCMEILGTSKFTMYVYGEILYRDVFGLERYMRYRLLHGGNEPVHCIQKDGVQQWLLKPDAEGNDSN